MKQMNKLFAESIKTPYLPELKLDADPWVKTQREREYRFLSNQRQTIYFNYQSIQLFKDDGSKKKLERYVLKTQILEFIYHLVLYLVLEQSFNKKEVDESISLIVSTNEIEQQTVKDDKKQKSVIEYFLKVENHQIDKTLVILLMQHVEKKRCCGFT
ncbi:hypothetical protein K501DRAFT_86326 [Backusella circina FSU 941]|nr:hypothetical protein K501DRAFT_86326 [Backusella circina FSU 941]